jgi:hypothetical protein
MRYERIVAEAEVRETQMRRAQLTDLTGVLDLPRLSQREYITEKAGMAIQVSGAGTEELNGIYVRSGLWGGLPMWSRRGMDIW